MTVKSLGLNLVLVFASVLGVLGALEIGARILIGREPVVTTGEQGMYDQFDPVLGWRNRPGGSVQYGRTEYRTHVTINALGFRDVERTVDRTPGVGRVLALGDSFVEGYTVELDETVTRRAEAASRGSGCPVEFVNAGVHGYSTDQEALWFQNEGHTLAPDVVLLFVYYNDIIHNVRIRYWGSPKPVVEVKNDALFPTNTPLPEPRSDGQPPQLRVKERRPIEGSALRQLVVQRLVTGAPDLYNRLASFGLWEPLEPESIPDELRAYRLKSGNFDIEDAWDKTSAILGVLSKEVRRAKAEPVLVYIPARFEISEQVWKLTSLRYGFDLKAWDRHRVRERVGKIAGATGWSFLDLHAALLAETGQTYLPLDGHWDRNGHATAARALVSFLQARKLMPCGGSPASTPAV